VTSLPTVVGVGAANNGAGSVTYAWPTGYTPVANDIAIIHAECAGTGGLTAPTGYAHVPNSPRAQGTNVTAGQMMWKRLDGSESGSGVTVAADPFGNHQVGFVAVYRGVTTSGNPYDTGGQAVGSNLSTSFSITGTSTTVDNCLIVVNYTSALDQTAEPYGAFSDGSLGSITNQGWAGTTTGNGGGVGILTGTKVTAGATGTLTSTLTSTQWTGIMIALVPAPDGLTRSQSESVTVSDGVVAGVTLARSQAETLTVADAQARALAEARAGGESVTVADTTTRALAEARGQAESVTIGDATAGSTGGNAARSLSESVTVSDATARALVQGRPLSESVTASDASARTTARGRSQSESVTLVDATARAVGRFRSQAESVTIGDAATRSLGLARTIGQPVTISDLVNTATRQARALAEAIQIVDVVVAHSSSGDQNIDVRATLTARRLQAELVDRLLTATLQHRRLTAEITD